MVPLINTAEASYKYAHGSYASLRTPFDSETIANIQKRGGVPGMQLAAGDDIVPGWTLSLMISAEGRN